jgi:hypothetical protein
LNAKQKVLKQKGKGNKPKRSQPITDNEINMLYEKGLLGDSSPESLLSTVWMNNCIQFGLRGVSEHYNLRFVILPNFILLSLTISYVHVLVKIRIMQKVLFKKPIIPVDDSNIQILSQFILSKMKRSLQWRQNL